MVAGPASPGQKRAQVRAPVPAIALKNAKTHSKKAQRQLAAQMLAFGPVPLPPILTIARTPIFLWNIMPIVIAAMRFSPPKLAAAQRGAISARTENVSVTLVAA